MGARPKDVDWERIEADYSAGVLSLRELGAYYGLTESAIRKRAARQGWTRDLSAKVHARADAMVRRQMVRSDVRAHLRLAERQIVEANAEYIASVRGAHRTDIARLRQRLQQLTDELEDASDPELWSNIRAIADAPLLDPTPQQQAEQERRAEQLKDALQRATGFPTRLAGLKVIADILRVLVGLEREALGLDRDVGPAIAGRELSDIERAARLMSILDRARKARAAAQAASIEDGSTMGGSPPAEPLKEALH